MRWMIVCALVAGSSLLSLTGCSGCGQEKSPEQIREETANATAKLKRETVAVAQGVKEGITKPKAVDINAASKSELVSLPGLTDPMAERIINNRPYENTDQLVSKRVISADQYDKIKDRIAVKK
jgi:DNA uptake protein ComE-like DNA-binding protein